MLAEWFLFWMGVAGLLEIQSPVHPLGSVDVCATSHGSPSIRLEGTWEMCLQNSIISASISQLCDCNNTTVDGSGETFRSNPLFAPLN